jgi:type II secretory pathway pseudopilin PulG
VTGPESSWWRDLLRNPEWWVQNIVVAVIVGVVVSVASIFGQYWVDNRRYAREDQLAERQARHDEQMQNLQFVRSGSSADPDQDRPYATFDLQGQNLAELQLAGADFAYANLSHSDLSRAELSMADFDHPNEFDRCHIQRRRVPGRSQSARREARPRQPQRCEFDGRRPEQDIAYGHLLRRLHDLAHRFSAAAQPRNAVS